MLAKFYFLDQLSYLLITWKRVDNVFVSAPLTSSFIPQTNKWRCPRCEMYNTQLGQIMITFNKLPQTDPLSCLRKKWQMILAIMLGNASSTDASADFTQCLLCESQTQSTISAGSTANPSCLLCKQFWHPPPSLLLLFCCVSLSNFWCICSVLYPGT